MASATAAKLTASEMRAPNMIADSTSRPWSSVPSRNVGLPLRLPRRRLQRVGEIERAQVERIVRRDPWREHGQNRQIASTIAEMTATGERRKL